MKILSSRPKRKHYVLPILVLLFCALVIARFFVFCNFSDADASFETFTRELFRRELSSSTLSLHYTLMNPEKYDLESAPVTLGSYASNPQTSKKTIDAYLTALSHFENAELSAQNQLTYNVLSSYLTTSKDGLPYLLYQEPLSPVIGMHAQLPLLLSEYQFYSVQDVKTYLTLLKQTGSYFDSIMEFESSKRNEGLFMPDYQIEEVISYCKSFVEMGKSNYLISSFEERITELDGLKASDQKSFLSKNQKLVQTIVFPAYRKLVTYLESQKGSGTNEAGLCNFPKGKSFYEYLLQSESGVSETVPELQKMTMNQIQDDLQAMQTVLQNETPEEATLRTSNQYTTKEPAAILSELKEKTISAFPTIPKVNIDIKFVSSAMEEYLSPAFYMIPAIDNLSENVIYINRGQTLEGLNLYTTLAHEGYPGHLYQTVYFSSQNPDPIRSILNYGGYVEGWATYTEMMSYYFADLPDDDAAILQKNNSLLLGLYAYADMGIHYDGWTLTDTIRFFERFGLDDSEIVEEIYKLIIGTPGNYAKYYLGYLKIYTLKKEIAAKLGANFSQLQFHKALLDVGPAPFDIVEKYVKDDLLIP